jgi:cell fate (sporulation/competence/biofilm development) regulator YlbF (YheA/YmcA/DUF963 family)
MPLQIYQLEDDKEQLSERINKRNEIIRLKDEEKRLENNVLAKEVGKLYKYFRTAHRCAT